MYIARRAKLKSQRYLQSESNKKKSQEKQIKRSNNNNKKIAHNAKMEKVRNAEMKIEINRCIMWTLKATRVVNLQKKKMIIIIIESEPNNALTCNLLHDLHEKKLGSNRFHCLFGLF